MESLRHVNRTEHNTGVLNMNALGILCIGIFVQFDAFNMVYSEREKKRVKEREKGEKKFKLGDGDSRKETEQKGGK